MPKAEKTGQSVTSAQQPRMFMSAPQERSADFLEAKTEWVHRLLSPPKRRALPRSRGIPTSAPLRNVLGIATGEKVSDGRHTGLRCILFLVQKKFPSRVLAVKHRLPRTVAGLPTDVLEIGIAHAFSVDQPDPRQETRPARPGCSIGFRDPTGQSAFAGTFGAVVRDQDGFYILSNNHVLADLDQLSKGAPTFQPGLLDEPDPAGHAIATLSRSIPLSADSSNLVDCAIAAPNDPSLISNDILFIGPPQGFGDPQQHMEVHKFGRSTSYTAGRITAIDGSVQLRMHTGDEYLFEDQVLIESLNDQPFGAEGDSGALVLDRQTQIAVGLLIGGTPTLSFANPLPRVLEKLQVQLV
jgi:hypothetical protein